MVRVSLGYPSADDEADMLAARAEHDRVLDLETVCEVGEVLAAQAAAARVHGSEALRRYIVAVLDATRADPQVELGASPRSGLMLFRAAKAWPPSTPAITRCPTTCRRWRRPCSRTGCCSLPTCPATSGPA